MDQSHKKSPIYVKTTDNQTVPLDKAIIQQSNLLTVLQDIYKGTEQQPLMAPVTKTELDLFSIAVRQPASEFAAKLNDKDYSLLMDITEKLKASLFYADLMEQILPVKELINYFARTCLDKTSLKKAIYKKHLKKKSTTLYKDNTATKIINLQFFYDGSYFAETITKDYDSYITNLRQTQNFFPFRIIQQAKYVTFSRDGRFIILCDYQGNFFLNTPDFTRRLDIPTSVPIFPEIHPSSNAIIIGNRLYAIDEEYNTTRTNISDKNTCRSVFHPSLPLIISAEKNEDSKTEITVHNLEQSTQKLVGTYQTDPHSNLTAIVINSDGSLLAIDNDIVLNIQDPYNPKILQLHIDTNSYVRINFITQKLITFFQQRTKTERFCLLNKKGKVILSGDRMLRSIITDPTYNYIALLFNDSNNLSFIEIFKISDLKKNTRPLIINEHSNVANIAFVNDQLLLTQSYTTKLWDMEGDEVLNFGRTNHYAIHPQTHSIIVSRNLTCNIPTDFSSGRPIQGPTKLYHYTIDTPKAQQTIKTITESLTLSQALLLNNYFSEKIKKEKKLYPNLPDGRVFDSLPEKHTFLAPNLKLRKNKYLPIQTIQQEEKNLSEK